MERLSAAADSLPHALLQYVISWHSFHYPDVTFSRIFIVIDIIFAPLFLHAYYF
jgi:hypothetical protein